MPLVLLVFGLKSYVPKFPTQDGKGWIEVDGQVPQLIKILSLVRMSSCNKLFIVMSLAILLVSGCASYKEVKNMDVTESYTVTGVNAEQLSVCVSELLREEEYALFYRNYDPISKKWFVLSEQKSILGTGNGNYGYSIAFSDSLNNITCVEIRSLKTIWGGLQAPSKKIKEFIKKCQEEMVIKK